MTATQRLPSCSSPVLLGSFDKVRSPRFGRREVDGLTRYGIAERQIQTAVAEILEDDQLTVESPTTSEEGFPFCGRCAATRDSEEQRVFEAWLARRAAFEELGVTRLDGADTEGFTLAQLEQRGKAPAKPLRRKLLKYLCEVE